jgi:thermitase
LREYIEFRIDYEHKLCLLGKQHGGLLYTITLLPGEKATLYHSDRYRRITSDQERYSVHTTFLQFLSVVHQARVTNTLNSLIDTFASTKTSGSVSSGGGLAGLLGLPGGSASTQVTVSDHNMLQVGTVMEEFNQSVAQSSQLTDAERSLVISTYEDKESVDVTSRTLQNDNDCRAVTYFVRKVVELYALSTFVSNISYRIIAPNILPDWHSINDLGWLPQQIQGEIKNALKLLPKIGDFIERPKPISLPSDGSVYDPELAHCDSCEPEREASILIQLEKQKAEAQKACLEVQFMELELERRRMLLQKGTLSPFEAPPVPVSS